MKRLVPILMVSLICGAAAADELSPAEKQKRMAKAMELAKPGPEHQLLAEMAGPFTQDIKIWPKPGAQPITMKTSGTSKMILGGRFLQSESKGGEGPMESESMSILGYDRRHEVYTMYACDSHGTYCVQGRGKFDPAQKAIVMSGEDDEVTLGGMQKYDFVLRRVSPDESVLEIVFKDTNHGNKEPFKMVEITRRKAKP